MYFYYAQKERPASGKCRSWVQPYSSGRFPPREEQRAMSFPFAGRSLFSFLFFSSQQPIHRYI